MSQETASPRASADLRHPVPDLQSLQGAYISNIERLEERAERMSSHGSDIAEEIRKLQLEQKMSDSRKSSLQSALVDDSKFVPGTRSRNTSTSSYKNNSVVDVNGAARWGGYSPAGFVASPVGSPVSQRQRSGSRASRLGRVIQTNEDKGEQIGHEESYRMSASHHSLASHNARRTPSNHSATSFSRTYDQIAQEIQDNFNSQDDNSPSQQDIPDRPATAASTDTYQQARTLFTDFDGVHCEPVIEEESVNTPRSSGSQMRESVQMLPPQHPPPADGMVYYPAPVPKTLNLPKRLSQLPAANIQARRRTQLLDAMAMENRKSAHWLDGAQNNSDGAGESSKANRKSMDPRKSRMSLAGLPPQLRASAFFDHSVPIQELDVKGESAEDTLDHILEASTHAPVSAFTDHPIVGHVGPEIYGKEQKRQSTATLLNDKSTEKKRRSSVNLLDTHRNSSGDPLNKLKKRNSSQDLNRLIVRESTSRMSLSGEFEGELKTQSKDEGGHETPTVRPIEDRLESHLDDRYDEEDEEEKEEQVKVEAPQYFGPPTTLLAELQMRKQQQKNRNKTAATAFPDGMHSTLLELDAVAEIERKKRNAARVPLAWEAPEEKPAEDDDSDDDVPLGVLFPGRDGLVNKAGAKPVSDWDRPLGLIAQRELEDHEPLSKRRNRLIGNDPNRLRIASPLKRGSQLDLPIPTVSTPQPEDEEEEETLAQRVRRLKNREALDGAIGDARKSTVSAEFASELLSQLGSPAEDDKPKSPPAPVDGEEETLGQRRARLKAEALARGDDTTRPVLKNSHSLADILSAHPIDSHNNLTRGISEEKFVANLPQGSLLHENEVRQTRHKAGMLGQNRLSSFGALDKPLLDVGQQTPDQSSPLSHGGLLEKNDAVQARHKADMLNQTRRISSFGNLDKPLVGDLGKAAPEQAIAAKIQAYKGNRLGGPISTPSPSMMFMPQMGGGMYPNMAMAGQQDGYFPAANMPMTPVGMGMGMGMGMTPNGYPAGNMMPQQMMMGMGMNMGMGMGMGSPMNNMPNMTYPPPNMGAMPMQMQMNMQQQMQQMEPMMDPRQRDMIDRWRQSVMH